MKKAKAIVFLTLLLLFFLALPFFSLLDKTLAQYCYKEIVYSVIVNNIVGKEKDPEKIAGLLFEYCYYDLFSPYEAEAVDKDVFASLFRGIAFCDQKTAALGTFAGKLGIDNRMVLSFNPEGISQHVMSELLIGKKWRFFDPSFGLVIRGPGGEIVSYEDIRHDPSLFYLSPDILMLKQIEPDKYQKVKEFYTRNVFNPDTKQGFWENPIKGKDLKRRIISGALDFYIGLFGKKFCYFYQDLYLKYILVSDTESAQAFNRARNYDLFERYGAAVGKYRDLIDNFPADARVEDALFFLGIIHYNMNDHTSSADVFQRLLRQYPLTQWRRIALYYSGRNHELLHELAAAKDCYWRAIGHYRERSKESLIPGEMKVIRRLCALDPV